MSVNKVILLGNVGKDPDVRYLDTGIAVASFSIATSERAYTLANGTNVPERTEWHNLVLWRGLAEIAEKFVRKGDKLYIEGKMKTRSYDDANGVKRYVTEVFVDQMEMLTPRNASGTAPQVESAKPEAVKAVEAKSQTTSVKPDEDSLDDLPF